MRRTPDAEFMCPLGATSSRLALTGRRLATLAVAGFCLAMSAPAAQAKNIALLVGVNAYPGSPLEGAVNDAKAMKDVLVRRWQFKSEDVRMLLDAEATHANILRELKNLMSLSAPNDHVFVYFSGHGTSALDKDLRAPLPHTSGAFLPVDVDIKRRLTANDINNRLIIGRTHLLPVLTELEQKGRHIFVAMDSCYSGNGVRSYNSTPVAFAKRAAVIQIDYDSFNLSAAAKPSPNEQADYPYKQVVFISAASESEVADDISVSRLADSPTLDGKPHGAMTDALVRALDGNIPADFNRDGKLSYSELHQAVRSRVQQNHQQTPQLLPVLSDAAAGIVNSGIFSSVAPPQAPESSSRTVRIGLAPSAADLRNKLNLEGVSFVERGGQLLIEKSGDGYHLRTGAGDTIIQGASLSVISNRLAAEVWMNSILKPVNAGFDMQFQTNRDLQGNNFMDSETLAFRFQASKPAHVLIVNVDAEGNLTQLYPQYRHEAEQLAAGNVFMLPSANPLQHIKVQPPFGLDHVIAIAFSETPEGLVNLPVLRGASVSSPDIKPLERLLKSSRGWSFRSLHIRTFPKDAAKS